MGNIYRNLTELCTTPACSVLSVQRWVLNALSYNVCRNERNFEDCKVLFELFRLVTMNCGGIIIPNSPSCEARLRQMTMTCGRITNYTSCVARQPLWHMIMACDHNTTQTSYGTRTFVVLLRGYEQNGADEASKFTRSIPHSCKSGNGSIRLRYVTKTRAQCPVHISINGSHRCYDETVISGMVATVSINSCSVGNTSFKYTKKTEPVKKTIKRKRDREPSRIPLHKVTKLFTRRKCRGSIRYLVKHNFPSSSIMRDFCTNYKKWSLWYNCDHFYFKYVYFINNRKGKRANNLCSCQKECSSSKMLHRSNFNHHSGYHTPHSLKLKGGMLPTSDDCNLSWVCLSERLSCISLMPYDVGGSGDCFFKSVSHQLYGTPELHFEIRMAGINHLNNHPEIYIESFSDNSWEDYIQQMSTPGTWCDNLIIQAVANARNCVVHITESDINKPHGTIITPILHEGRSNTIFIGYINELQYVSTIPLRSSQNRNKLTYLKRKLLESDHQKDERLAKKRSSRHAETNAEREIRLLNIRQNVAKKRVAKADDNSRKRNSEHSNTNSDNYLIPPMEQKHVLRNIDLFHKSNDYLIKQCTVCMEAWPSIRNRQSRTSSDYKCSRCTRDKNHSKKFSKQNNMIPSAVL